MKGDIVELNKKLVIATRLHLGNASAPPSMDKIQGWIQNLISIVSSAVDAAIQGVIAVDASTSKIKGYDYVQAIQEQLDKIDVNNTIVILPVTPWGKFVPALNALVQYAHEVLQADQILFVSAEVSVSATSIQTLSSHCTESTEDDDENSYVLVAGAALNGHLYQGSKNTEITVLNGRSCPWNTLALWNVPKLVLTGFVSVSDVGTTAGVEECAAVALHQHIFPQARAKLVQLYDVQWQEHFDDEERRQWHERKMNSKLERAATQLQLLGLKDKGVVEHC